MTLDGNRLRTATRLFAVGLALFVLRAAVACGGSASDTESDSCKQRQGHCASGGLTATCTREEVAFVDTCLCCVPANLVMNLGDDDDDAAPTSDAAPSTDAAGSTDGAAASDSASTTDSGATDAGADGAG